MAKELKVTRRAPFNESGGAAVEQNPRPARANLRYDRLVRARIRLAARRYSIFGIAVDRNLTLKWLFPTGVPGDRSSSLGWK
jgi:hypothetical protein